MNQNTKNGSGNMSNEAREESPSECIDEELGNLILDYGLGLLNEEETARFEEHVLDCGYCRRELKHMTPVLSSLRRNRAAIHETLLREGLDFETRKRELLASSHPAPSQNESMSRAIRTVFDNLRRSWRVAIAAVAVAGAIAIFLPNIIAGPNRYLALLSFVKLEVPTQRDYPEGEERLLVKTALEAYDKGDYKDAIINLKKALKNDPDRAESWIFLGSCYYLTRQPRPAIQAWTRADTLSDFYAQIQIRRYLARAYLLNRDPDKAISLVNWIIREDRTNTEEDKSFLEEIIAIRDGKTRPVVLP